VADEAAATSAAAGANLRADCVRCFGLCCVAPAFAVSADFAGDKPAGLPCAHLQADFRCGIHERLRACGYAGCVAYDCFGAGQHVAQVTFGGQDWRQTPGVARQMFDVFGVMRQLHELLWYLDQALRLPAARPLDAALRRAREDTEYLTRHSVASLLALDVATHREHVNPLLVRASELARAAVRGRRLDFRSTDLVGRDLRGVKLSGANLRGAMLIGADLRDTNLRLADFTGADCRGANMCGADLSESIFVSQSQVSAALGDGATRLPPSLARPTHWRFHASGVVTLSCWSARDS
jgi:uncharacterized protein YjbI with pentapeptide repeats